jgi:hypothetical protein
VRRQLYVPYTMYLENRWPRSNSVPNEIFLWAFQVRSSRAGSRDVFSTTFLSTHLLRNRGRSFDRIVDLFYT